MRIGNIDDAALEGVTAVVEPRSAASWLKAEATKNSNSAATITLRVTPTALTGDHHDATVTVSAASARNTASFSVHADNTMLPQPEHFVVFHVNTTDSFAYPELTWEDIAEGEDGYYVEFFTPFNWNTKWKVIDTIAANSMRYVSPLHEYADTTRENRYRIRAFTNDGLYSPYSEEGGFGVPPDSLVPPPQDKILEPWVAENASSMRWTRPVSSSNKIVRGPSVSCANGRIRIRPGRALGEGFVVVAETNGRIITHRKIADVRKDICEITLPSHSAGVLLITIGDGAGSSHTLRHLVRP